MKKAVLGAIIFASVLALAGLGVGLYFALRPSPSVNDAQPTTAISTLAPVESVLPPGLPTTFQVKPLVDAKSQSIDCTPTPGQPTTPPVADRFGSFVSNGEWFLTVDKSVTGPCANSLQFYKWNGKTLDISDYSVAAGLNITGPVSFANGNVLTSMRGEFAVAVGQLPPLSGFSAVLIDLRGSKPNVVAAGEIDDVPVVQALSVLIDNTQEFALGYQNEAKQNQVNTFQFAGPNTVNQNQTAVNVDDPTTKVVASANRLYIGNSTTVQEFLKGTDTFNAGQTFSDATSFDLAQNLDFIVYGNTTNTVVQDRQNGTWKQVQEFVTPRTSFDVAPSQVSIDLSVNGTYCMLVTQKSTSADERTFFAYRFNAGKYVLGSLADPQVLAGNQLWGASVYCNETSQTFFISNSDESEIEVWDSQT